MAKTKKTTTTDFSKLTHHELELKFELTDMDKAPTPSLLVRQLYRDFPQDVRGVRHVDSPDVYYQQGENVMRFRSHPNGQGGELTVKLRTNKKSIANRVEVDIPLGDTVLREDVEAFAAATGWKEVLRLVKRSTIIRLGSAWPWEHADKASPPVIIAVYSVTRKLREDDSDSYEPWRTFLEVELDKDFTFDLGDAELHLERWHGYFLRLQPLDFPKKALNKSLYELYSGKTYQLAKTK